MIILNFKVQNSKFLKILIQLKYTKEENFTKFLINTNNTTCKSRKWKPENVFPLPENLSMRLTSFKSYNVWGMVHY